METVGVGIVLKPSFSSDTFLALVVHSLVPGSSAEQSKLIQVSINSLFESVPLTHYVIFNDIDSIIPPRMHG
jgi:hypothetical protein